MDSDQRRVCQIEWHSEGIFELQLDREDLPCVPGDCVALYAEDGETSRPYSCASGMEESVLRFVIRRMEGGVVSTFLAGLKPGDLVKVSPPFGWFRPGAMDAGQPFVFIATGTGISPFLSYFRSHPEQPPVQCLYGVRTLSDAVDLEWLRTVCDLKLAVSREGVVGAHHGRVTDLLDDMPVTAETNYFLCGLDAMIDEASAWLEAKGVEITHIHRECFFNSSYTA